MTSIASIPVSSAPSLRPTLRIMDPVCEPCWDKLIEAHPGATFFHTAAWAKTLASAYNFNCRYITATAGEEIHALLPLIEARSWLRGTRGVSLPFTDECPVLISPPRDAGSPVTANDLLDAAMREGAARRWKYLELRGGLDSFHDVPQSSSYYGHVLELGGGPSGLPNCDSSVRRAIRKAEREGVSVQLRTDPESVRAYYNLHCRTRTRLGAPPQPFRFFESIWRHILEAGQGFIALAMHHSRPIAGAVFFHFARKAIYKFSASDERFQQLRGSNLVIRAALERLIAAGIHELNFGRTSLSNEGLRRFKLGWGSREYMIRCARYSFSSRCFVPGNDASTGSHTRILARLPVFAARWIGRLAYPHMA